MDLCDKYTKQQVRTNADTPHDAQVARQFGAKGIGLTRTENNPMLGHRGCRLGITFPEITAMQTRAILGAACELKKEGKNPMPEIMVPLIGTLYELKQQKEVITSTAKEVFAAQAAVEE